MISVVICTYNRAASLAKTLESLNQMTVPAEVEWEIVVVDNNSNDFTYQVIEEFRRRSGLVVRYVFEAKQGLSNARNTGIANAAGEIIAFTDDDVLVTPEWLKELAYTFAKFDCAAVGGRITPVWDGIAKPKWFATNGPYFLGIGPVPSFEHGDEAKEISDAPVGANAAFKKSAFERCGFFKTDIGPGASNSGIQLGDDIEFGLRLIRRGQKIIYSPRAVVLHPAEQDRITKSYFLHFYYNLGRMFFRRDGWPREFRLWFGVPLRALYMLARKCGRWFLTLNSEKRFYYKVQAYMLAGRILETRVLHKSGIKPWRQPATKAPSTKAQARVSGPIIGASTPGFEQRERAGD